MSASANVAKRTFLTTTRLIIISALLALLVGIISSVGVVQQAYADDDDAYALLYDDGTLVFQRGDTPDDTKGEPAATIEVDESAVYSEDSLPPWYTYRENIYEIEFADTITPQSSVSYYFYGLSNCKSMDLTNLNCSKCTYSSSSTRLGGSNNIFDGCSSLVSLVQPSSLTGTYDMSSRFKDCSSLVSLDISGQSSTMMIDEEVFLNCTSLRYIKTSIPQWTRCYLGGRQGTSGSPCDIPAYTGKTWYYISENESVVLDTPLTSAFSTGSGGALPSLVGYTTYYDRLPLSECTLSVNLEGDSLSYYVTNSDCAKLTEDMDYTLKCYYDEECTQECELSELTEYPGVYYFRAEEVADYTAYSGNTEVVPLMSPVTLDSSEILLDDEVTFDYFFGDAPYSSINVESSNEDYVSTSWTLNSNTSAYEITLQANTITDEPITITLSCTTPSGEELSTSFEVTVTGDRKDIGECNASVDDLTYAARELSPQITVNGDNGEVSPNYYTYSFYSNEDCTVEVNVYNAGIYYVKIVGQGNYEGTLIDAFEVAKAIPTFSLYDPFGTFRNNIQDSSSPVSLNFGTNWSTQTNSGWVAWTLLGDDDSTADYEIVLSSSADDVECSYDLADRNFSITAYTLGEVTVSFGIVFPADGNYEDIATDFYFNVTEASLSAATVDASLDDNIYDGTAKVPIVEVTLGDAVLAADDYDLVYYDADMNQVSADSLINAGTYYVQAVGKGNYTGTTATASFIIEQADPTLTVDPASFELDVSDEPATTEVTYNGDGDITVISGNENVVMAEYANGIITITPIGGGTTPITVRAAEGSNYKAATVYIDVTVTGTVVAQSYPITVDVEGSGSVTSFEEACEGDTVTLTVEPDEGYELGSISVVDNTGTNIAVARVGSDDGLWTFTMPASAVSVEAIFTLISVPEPDSYVVIVVTEGDGSVIPSATEASEGETITLTVEADEGFEIGEIAITDTEGAEIAYTPITDGSYSFVMPASDVTVNVSFAVVTEPGVGDPGDGGDGDNGGTSGGTSGNTAGFEVIDEDNTGIGVDIDLLESITNAEGYTGSQLVITPLTEGDSDYDTLAGVATGTLVGVYDVTLYVNGQIQRADFGTLTLTFPVGEEYNGQTVKLWQLHEGEDPVYYEKVVENGVVTVTVDRLSAFAVDVQTEESGTSSTSGTGTGSGSDSSGSGSGTTTGTGSSGTTSGDDLTKSSDGLSKTGDNTLVGVSLLACIGVIAVAAFVLTGRRRKSAESVSGHKDV